MGNPWLLPRIPLPQDDIEVGFGMTGCGICHLGQLGGPPSAENAEGWGTLFIYAIFMRFGVAVGRGGPPAMEMAHRRRG